MVGFCVLFRVDLWAVPVLFSIVIHEVSHGWMANRLGDDTAMRMGRLTLSPLPHKKIGAGATKNPYKIGPIWVTLSPAKETKNDGAAMMRAYESVKGGAHRFRNCLTNFS